MGKQLRWKDGEWCSVVGSIDLCWTGPNNAPSCNAIWYKGIRRGGKRMRRINGRMPAGIRARGDKTGGRRKGQALMKLPKHLWQRVKKTSLEAIVRRLRDKGALP